MSPVPPFPHNDSITGLNQLDANQGTSEPWFDRFWVTRKAAAFWHKCGPREQQKLTITTILSFIALLMAIAFVSIQSTDEELAVADRPPPICMSRECVATANRLWDQIDVSTSPCENFYKFACGNFARNRALNDDDADRSIDEPLLFTESDKLIARQFRRLLSKRDYSESGYIAKIRNFYQACIDTGRFHSLSEVWRGS